jgi:hypothetical protein
VDLKWGDPPGGADGFRYAVTLLTEHYQGEFVDKIAVSSGSGSPSGASSSGGAPGAGGNSGSRST